MTPVPSGDGRTYGPDVDANTVVQALIPLVAHTDELLRVRDGEAVVGVVDRAAVMSALIEDEA
jgi:hypothetical protein